VTVAGTASVPLIGLAHGSRNPLAAAAVGELMAAVGRLRPGLSTCSAYLDLSEPDLRTVVRGLGVERAVVVPLLFAQAFHASKDVPDAVREAARGSRTELITADILGLGPDVLALLHERERAANIADDQDILLLAVGTSDPVANDAIVDLARRWSKIRGGAVRTVFATTAPRAMEALAEPWTSPPAVVPLFLAPGLLLDQVARRAAKRGVVVAQPLAATMAQVVLDRYDATLQVPKILGSSLVVQ